MSLYREDAVVLRSFRLGEADRIIVLLGATRGKIRAVAKGVRKTKSRFGGRLEPTSHLSLLVYESRRPMTDQHQSRLDTITQAETIDSFRVVREDLSRLGKAMALVEAVDQVSVEAHPDRRLYSMLVGALRALAERDSALMVPAFYLKVLAGEGALTSMDGCATCGQDLVGDGPVGFDVGHGGALCARCAGAVAAPVMSGEALELVRMVLGGALAGALEEPASRATVEVQRLATRSLEHHIERRLRSVAALEG